MGTGNHRLLVLQRDQKLKWTAREIAVASQAIYRLVELPSARAVFVLSLSPARLWVFDLDSQTLKALPVLSQVWEYAAAGLGGGRVWVTGRGALGSFTIERRRTSLQHTANIALCSDCGVLSGVLSQQTAGEFTVAGSNGQVLNIDVSALGRASR